MWKVKGEVKPADLFTKHLGSRVKILQLIQLFWCEYREGRPGSTPFIIVIEEHYEDVGVPVRGPNVLPHEHEEKDLQVFLPKALPHAPQWNEIIPDNNDNFDSDLFQK